MPHTQLHECLERVVPESLLEFGSAAFNQFYDDLFHRFARCYVRRDDVDDLVNDVWVRALSHMDTFCSRPPFQLRKWLRTIVCHRARDCLRKRRRRHETSLDELEGVNGEFVGHDAGPVDLVHVRLMRAAARTALEQLRLELGEVNYRILTGQHFEGRLQSELGAEFGLTEKQARYRAAHAYEKVRERMTAYLGPLD